VLCNLHLEEFTYHLIFQCPFNMECWNFLGIYWDHGLYFFETIIKAKRNSHLEYFMEVFSIVVWEIRKQRNAIIFKGILPTFQSWKDSFISTANH
jgi:hypothetical protein